MTIDYFYSLTPRQFYNIQKGWSEKRETDSNERMILTRRLMFASLLPWSKNLTEEESIWKLPFESNEPLNLSEHEIVKGLEATEKYWEDIDKRRNQKPPE